MNNQNKEFNPDDLLNSIIKSANAGSYTIRELFDQRLEEMQITQTAVAKNILNIDRKTLNSILDGTQKTIDFKNLVKIASFIQVPIEDVFKMMVSMIETNFPDDENISPEKIEFIKNNFDLAALRKSKFIDSITDFKQIEKKINEYFGFKSIFEYKRPAKKAAFSAGAIEPKSVLARDLWLSSGEEILKEIDNPYRYDRDALISYFPDIRWHCTNIELGLLTVIKSLYKMGITVIYKEEFKAGSHLRGATLSVNGKPCIILTDYRGYYATVWFALMHELYHVLMDWEEIKIDKYHISDTSNNDPHVYEQEQEANQFARAYLFSLEKTNDIKTYLKDSKKIEAFAKNNHVHPSLIYTFYAKDCGSDRTKWAIANKYNPNFDKLKRPFANEGFKSVSQYAKYIKNKIYN